MRIYDNGVYRDMTKEEIKTQTEPVIPPLTYEQRVVSRIRERYSVDDELALLRQRVLKSAEFEEYFGFVEKIKEEERNV